LPHYEDIMIFDITYAKRIRETGGMLIVPIPKEIVDEMHLVERELIEVRITKKTLDENCPTDSV